MQFIWEVCGLSLGLLLWFSWMVIFLLFLFDVLSGCWCCCGAFEEACGCCGVYVGFVRLFLCIGLGILCGGFCRLMWFILCYSCLFRF